MLASRSAAGRTLLASLCIIILQATAQAQTGERQIYDLGTATTEGVSHPLGVTISALIKLKLLPLANIDVDAKNTQGSRNNAQRLRHGDLDFAILTTLDAYHAFRGTGPFVEDGVDPSLRLLTNLWASSYHFVVRTEFAATGTFTDFLNLTGRRIALGEDGSATLDHVRALFAALDVDVDEAYQRENLGGRDAAKAFLKGDLDGFVLVDEKQGADITTFLEQASDSATALTFSDIDIDAINNDGVPTWTRAVIPVESLPGQTEEQITIAMHNLLGASERVPEDAVYQITKTIFDNLPFLQEMHSATVGISLESALEQLVLPVHEGATAYYREVGVTVPEPEPVRTSSLSQTAFLTRFGTVQEARARLNEDTITILGGQAGQTVTRMTSELAATLSDANMRVIGMTNPKPADNIANVLYARGVDSAVVPLDILNYALEQNIYPDIRNKIAYATELFTEEMHLVALSTIGKIEDLLDRPVNLGPKGSASEFTASFLLDRLNIPVEPAYHDQRTALALLKSGELSAVFTISGKPMPLLQEIQSDQGLRLLEVPALDGTAYRPATLAAADYPSLLAAGEEISTFGVRSALISYNWRSDNPRYAALSRFIGAFFDRLPTLQEQDKGYHPKWRGIDPFGEIQGWRRSPAAQSWLQIQATPAEAPKRADG